MKFFNRLLDKQTPEEFFSKIQGYEDVKEIVRRVLNSQDNYNLIFVGSPSSGKTLFLEGIMNLSKDAVYFDATNMTNRILDILVERRPKIVCIDKIEKASKVWQEKLLNLMENGRVKVDQQRKSYDFTIKGLKVFSTCNDISRLSKPLQSRFRKIFLPKYSEEFLDICEKVLPKLSPSIARYIGNKVYNSNGDIRSVQQIGKLVERSDGPEDIERIMGTLMKYGKDVEVRRNDYYPH